VTNGVGRGVGGGERPGRPHGGRERRATVLVPGPRAGRELGDRLGAARSADAGGVDVHRGRGEAPQGLGLHPLGPRAPSTLVFQNNMRTALAIKDGQLHRWSVTASGVLGPGVPGPFRQALERPSPDGRSVTSLLEGRVYDAGAWPPRPSGVRLAHPGWLRPVVWNAQNEVLSNGQFSPDGRFIATWSVDGGYDWRLWRLPRPHSRPPPAASERVREPQQPAAYFRAAFDARGTRIVLSTTPRAGRPDGADVRVVDVATGFVRGMTACHAGWIRDVGSPRTAAISPRPARTGP
jgi:hypothetical protein